MIVALDIEGQPRASNELVVFWSARVKRMLVVTRLVLMFMVCFQRNDGLLTRDRQSERDLICSDDEI